MNEGHGRPHMTKRVKSLIDKPVVESSHKRKENVVSTNEGQENSVFEAVSEGFDGVEAPLKSTTLEPEKDENGGDAVTEGGVKGGEAGEEPVGEENEQETGADQNLDEFEAVLGESEAEKGPKFSHQELANLTKMMAESADVASVAVIQVPSLTREDMAILEKPSTDGPQSDGSVKVTISISEEYAEGCRQAAESDGRWLAQWATENFQFFLEGYFTPAKGR